MSNTEVMSRYEYMLEVAMSNTDMCLTELIELGTDELEELIGW